MSTIQLTYKRMGETYVGSLDGNEFEGVTYAQMMRLAHLALVEAPESELCIQRTDRAGLLPVYLEKDMRDLLRTDPARYIEAHSLPPRVIYMTTGRTSRLGANYDMPKHNALRAGHDTLAAAFGDLVYIKMRRGHLEHPLTGRYEALWAVERSTGLRIQETLNIEGDNTGWVTIKTLDLLTLPVDRFFIPREWNEPGPWITKAALQERYATFNKEREACLATKAH